jgi:hypothetical protein
MSSSPSRRSTVIVVLLLLLLALVLLFWSRCRQPRPEPAAPPPVQPAAPATPSPGPSAEARDIKVGESPREVLGAATLAFTPTILAGAEVSIQWTGPNNKDDFLSLVKPDAPAHAYTTYTMTDRGNPATLAAPVEAGRYEIRYVAGRSKTVLARAPLDVTAAAATLKAPETALIGSQSSGRVDRPEPQGRLHHRRGGGYRGRPFRQLHLHRSWITPRGKGFRARRAGGAALPDRTRQQSARPPSASS